MGFRDALIKIFDLELLGEALITSVWVAGKASLNVARVTRNWTLIEKFEGTLTANLAFLQERENKKAADPMPECVH